MPSRGRDTYYLELVLAGFSIRLAFLCFSRWINESPIVLSTPFGIIPPLWVWGILWTLSAAGILTGFFGGRSVVTEYSALFTTVLWLQTVYWTSHVTSVLTIRLGWAIIISLASVLVYLYQARVAWSFRRQVHGRSSE